DLITDIAPGKVSNTVGDVFYKVKQQATGNFWDWGASTFAVTGTSVTLVAHNSSGTLNNGGWTYTTDYFQNNSAWVPSVAYTVQMFAKDKAQNANTVAITRTFTFDNVAATATITL